jgi:hypothetical protein
VRPLGDVRVGLSGKLEGVLRHRILAARPAVGSHPGSPVPEYARSKPGATAEPPAPSGSTVPGLSTGNGLMPSPSCANGIGTPRLLLSASAEHPDGLANFSGLVGKNLMLHPNCSVTGFYGEDLESWRGPARQLIHSME